MKIHDEKQTINPVRYLGEIPLREAPPEIGYRVQRRTGTYQVTRIEPNGLCFGVDVEYLEQCRIPEPILVAGAWIFL